MAYVSDWNTVVYFPRLKLSFFKEYGIILITKMDVEERGYGFVD
jgi:hypothetical protein